MRLAWLDEMEAAFGSSAKRSVILADLTATRTAFGDASLAGSSSAKRLDEALAAFGATQYDEAISAARSLRGADDPVALLPAFARARAAAVTNGRAVAEAARAFLDHVQGRLEEEASQQAAKVESAQADIAAIDSALAKIDESLEGLEVANVA